MLETPAIPWGLGWTLTGDIRRHSEHSDMLVKYKTGTVGFSNVSGGLWPKLRRGTSTRASGRVMVESGILARHVVLFSRVNTSQTDASNMDNAFAPAAFKACATMVGQTVLTRIPPRRFWRVGVGEG
jgi:hypothetical protein